MHYVTRQHVCDKLRVSSWQSYQLAHHKRHHLIADADIIALLNASRRDECEVVSIPGDLMTTDEVAKMLGILPKRVVNWTRRARNPLPHFRINKMILRVRRTTLERWLEEGA